MSNPLSNPLLESGFDGSVNLEALAGVMDPSFNDQNGDGVPDHYNQELAPLHTNHRGYVGEDGSLYRKEVSISPEGEVSREYTDERLYFWTPPQELGRAPNDPAAQERAMAGPKGFGAAGLYTEAEIKEAWEADEGMGYLKEHTDWNSYWNFVQKTTDLFTDPTYNDMTDGNMAVGNFQDSPEYMALLEETGIPTQYINDDGDVFNFNGTTYVKDYKTDDSIGVDVINSAFLGIIGSVVAGPLVAGALAGTGMSAAAAKAASSAIMSLAQDAMTTGDLSFGDALLSAGMAYGGDKLVEAIKGGGVIDAVGQAEGGDLKAIVDGYAATGKYSQETLDKMYEIAQGAAEEGGNMTDALGTLGDLVGAVGDAYLDNDDYNVDYGGADPDNTDIINNGTQNEDDEFEEDFGVDTNIDMPTITPNVEDVEVGGGGDVTDGDVTNGDVTNGDVTGGDVTGGDTTTQGQYEVVGQREDGKWIVKDNVDGDVWVVDGDYAVGDFIPEEGMVDAVGAEGELDGDGVNTDTDVDADVNNPITNSQIDILIDRGMTQEQAEANQESAINQGADANGDGMVTDEEWTEHTGGDVTDGDVTDGDVTDGDVTNGGNGGDGNGNGNGGDGNGNGNGNGVGLLAGGGGYTPEWGELFQYTTITPYQAKQLEPVRQHIAKARGMLS
jgi:hypothetical protein